MARVLILGGTAEANALAETLAEAGRREVIVSLAGRTAAPRSGPAPIRRGGFGGPEGLRAYLEAERISAVIDATHPFAGRISEHAARACAAAGVARVALSRPPWRAGTGDDWRGAAGGAGAAALLPPGARAFLALGRQRLEPFAARADVWFLIRVVDPPTAPLLPGPHLAITGRGPFAVEDERALITAHDITHLVARNSGGAGARAKLVAARELTVPVIMIARPPPPPEPVVETIASALAWLDAALG
jgi:precorrin-6A/cobalt-precorrin-6A reductase